ncbi:hypothetical protein ACFE04_003478 [Oxalis oulophora]
MDSLIGTALLLTPGPGLSKFSSWLPSIAQTQRLWITCQCMKILCDDDCFPILDKLRSLQILNFGLTDDAIPSLVTFLQTLERGLKTLRIKDAQNARVQFSLVCARFHDYKPMFGTSWLFVY